MHPRIAELIRFLDEQHEIVRAAFDAVPRDHRERRPASDQWSTAEVISHLAIVERGLTKILAKRIADVPAPGLRAETDASPILPTIDVPRILDRNNKFVSPARIDPRQSSDFFGWNDYENVRADFKAMVLKHDGLAWNDISLPHPVFGEFGGYWWIAFVGAHASRHAAQIREIAAATSD